MRDVLLPTGAIAVALLLFGLIVSFAGVNPVEVWTLLFKGAFGDWFSWQNTLQRAAPLMLTALCVALPARAGLTVIGGEGALVEAPIDRRRRDRSADPSPAGDR